MKGIKILIYIFSLLSYAKAQKPVLDSTAIRDWQSIGSAKISSNGKYVMYEIQNKPIGKSTLVLKSVDSKWMKEYARCNDAQFTSDGKYVVIKSDNNSLMVLLLGSNILRHIPNVSFYEIIGKGKNEYLCYMLNNEEDMFVVGSLNSKEVNSYKGVIYRKASEDGEVLIIKTESTKRNGFVLLSWIDVKTGKSLEFWDGPNVDNVVFDLKHTQLVFKSQEEIWHYKYGDSSANRIMSQSSDGLRKNLKLGRISHFSKDNQRIYFYLDEYSKPSEEFVEIWSYSDPKLQSELNARPTITSYLFSISLLNSNVTSLQKSNEFPYIGTRTEANIQDSIILTYEGLNGAPKWMIGGKRVWSLMSLKTGERTSLSFLENNWTPKLSPSGKFIFYMDFSRNCYFSYEIATHRLRNLTNGISVDWMLFNTSDNVSSTPRGIACWMKDDKSLLVYDQNDIWKLDLLNEQKPVNVTNGFGKRNAIVFYLGLGDYERSGLSTNSEIILNAFNLNNKDNGFFKKKIDINSDPVSLSMGPYLYQLKDNPFIRGFESYPIKALEANVYLVKRTSATKSPNYFLTRDFKSFKQISNIDPESKFNWYSTELHSWTSLSGRKLQGILYKPENFDPNKKYPVIFYYYEKLSDRLNAYLKPKISGGQMDIPTYVSNGYLVFTPDIHYTIGDPMKGVYDAVVSAASYISKLPCVNALKMGAQGHSFGGTQTNYLITHTNKFAAACSASGISDLVSAYGSVWGGEGNPKELSFQNYFENSQFRMGGSLWAKPESYINSSSIFQIHKVTTPLLMMHTKKDDICLYGNALEFFTGLRRMGKKVWMLVYSQGNHELDGMEANDFSIRMRQFFDHYLKDKPVPTWMMRTVSNSNKGLNSDLTLSSETDSTGKPVTPGPGLLTPKEQRKVDSLITKEPIIITLK